MKLYHSQTSPYVRKITLLLHETGLMDRVEIETIDGWSEPAALTEGNPLSMVPTLILEDGQSLFDSPVICEYLDNCHAGLRLIPEAGDWRWQVLRDQALADGVWIAPFSSSWNSGSGRRISAGTIGWRSNSAPSAVPWMPGKLSADALGSRVDLGTIAIAAALAYLDLRGAVGDWRSGRPGLNAWFGEFSQRPSMIATAPLP